MKQELDHKDQNECQLQNCTEEQLSEERNWRDFSRAEKKAEKLWNKGKYKLDLPAAESEDSSQGQRFMDQTHIHGEN